MNRKPVQSFCLVLVLTTAGSTFANVIFPGRFYSSGTGSNESSPSTPPNGSQPAEVRSTPEPASYPGLRSQAFDIGPEVYGFNYEEPGFMEEEGTFFGIRFGYTDRDWVPRPHQTNPPDGGTMLRAEARLAYGQVDYDGQLMDGTPYTIDDIDDYAFEARLLLGGDWLADRTLNTIYAGVGYRYLFDEASKDPAGYDRESNYFYVPVGFQFDSNSGLGWSLGFNVEFDIFIVGVQESKLSDVGFIDIENVQESGYGYRASFRLQHKSPDWIFILEPFVRYWDIDRSEIEYEYFGSFYEPANETEEIGISALLMF